MFSCTFIVYVLILFLTTYSVHMCEVDINNSAICENLMDAKDNLKFTWKKLYLGEKTLLPQYEFTSETFLYTNNLEELHIVGQLTGIKENAFNSGYQKLVFLNMINNELKELKQNSFKELHLKQLYLHFNKIQNIEKHTFDGTTSRLLDLSGNNITTISKDQITVHGLLKLKMKKNAINYIEPHSFPSTLKELDLEFNNLSGLDQYVLIPLVALTKLNLAHNQLKYIVKIETLRNLEELDLSYNKITSLAKEAFSPYSSLKILNLRDNKISYLAALHVPKNSEIRELYIANNYLASLDGELGNNLQKLNRITIFGNPWNCKCLEVIDRYLAEKQISKSACEENLFGKGAAPVCIAFDNVCRNIDLTKDLNKIQEYLKVVKDVDC